MRPLHDRMPVMLAGEQAEAWLDPRTPAAALGVTFDPAAAPALELVPVSTLVNRPGNDDARCVEPVSS